MDQGLNPCGWQEAHPEWTQGPFSILYSGSNPGIRQLECDADHPPPTPSAEVADGLELYFLFVCLHRLIVGVTFIFTQEQKV